MKLKFLHSVLILGLLFQLSLALGPINNIPLKPKAPTPYALSPTYLEFLAKQERTVYSAMKDYDKELEHRLSLVKKYLRDYEKSSISGTSLAESDKEKDQIISQHPILAFRMLSRYANEFHAIGEHISQKAEQVTSSIIHEAHGDRGLPKLKDAEDGIVSILRTQHMYELRASDISEGKIPGQTLNTAVKLTTQHCYNIAKTALEQKFYTLALEWFDTTSMRLKHGIEDPTVQLPFNSTTLEQDKHSTIAEHNRLYGELYENGHEYIFAKKIKTRDGPRPVTLRHHMVEHYAHLQLHEEHQDYYQSINAKHIALCNGANFQSKKELSKLKCYLDTKRNPYWRIRPLKVELINRKPEIIQIHDFIPDKWISTLKRAAYAELERAPTGPNATPRTAAYSWFPDHHIPQVPISRRIELVTGLNVVGLKAAEALQVAAYAFGGHVELHFDSKGPDDLIPDPKGERVTTFLIYLNDVAMGGGLTAFPKLGFAVEPIKGSAILWYTNLKHGGVDPWTLHAACPLISGHKWIATKWTHANENIFKRPCGLSPGA